jgi:hypothetical protein
VLPATAAGALLATVVVAGVAGHWSQDAAASPASAVTYVATTDPVATAPPSTVPGATVSPSTTEASSHLSGTIGFGSYGDDVRMVQQRLKELGFEPGPVDGAFGELTRAAVWAYEKLVLGTPRADATGRVTDEMWQRMQRDEPVRPRRPSGRGTSHTEVYLPQQVVVFFVDDRPALISHMSSGSGTQWCEEVVISPGELGNEHGTEPLRRGECGISNTPGGVYRYYRRVEGVRQSALGGMWNPVYFNYGIAIHGARQVPLEPASHGCIRVPMAISELVQDLVRDDDQVYVFDGVEEPEMYGAQLPTFNWLDPDYEPSADA